MTAPENETTTETPPAQRPLRTRVAESWEITYLIIAASLSTLALALVDTAVLGRYSTEALATVGLARPTYVFASALMIPSGTAVQILVAR